MRGENSHFCSGRIANVSFAGKKGKQISVNQGIKNINLIERLGASLSQR